MKIVNSIKNTLLNKEMSLDIKSPMQGHLFHLEQVSNKIANSIVGEGIAIIPTGNNIVAPCSGRICNIFKKNSYSFNIETEEGLEIVIQVGAGVDSSNEDAFKCFIHENQKVETGELILELNLPVLRDNLITTISPVVLSNSQRVLRIQKYSGFVEAGISNIMTIYFV
jgi:PTS system glucose-specific IIA component